MRGLGNYCDLHRKMQHGKCARTFYQVGRRQMLSVLVAFSEEIRINTFSLIQFDPVAGLKAKGFIFSAKFQYFPNLWCKIHFSSIRDDNFENGLIVMAKRGGVPISKDNFRRIRHLNFHIEVLTFTSMRVTFFKSNWHTSRLLSFTNRISLFSKEFFPKSPIWALSFAPNLSRDQMEICEQNLRLALECDKALHVLSFNFHQCQASKKKEKMAGGFGIHFAFFEFRTPCKTEPEAYFIWKSTADRRSEISNIRSEIASFVSWNVLLGIILSFFSKLFFSGDRPLSIHRYFSLVLYLFSGKLHFCFKVFKFKIFFRCLQLDYF